MANPMSTPVLVIFVIAIVIVGVIAWKELGGRDDLERLRGQSRRDRQRDPGSSD